MIDFFKGIFCEGETNIPSSKRFVGIISSISLIIYMFVFPSSISNNSVLLLALGGLGLSTIDKIFKK